MTNGKAKWFRLELTDGSNFDYLSPEGESVATAGEAEARFLKPAAAEKWAEEWRQCLAHGWTVSAVECK